jgi:acetyltransferase-like isoleucine patch superfamily enzyme
MLKKIIPRFIKVFIFYIYDKYYNILKRIEFIGSNVYFPISCKVDKASVFQGANKLGSKTSFSGTLGYGSYVGANSKLTASVGKYCSISDDVKTVSGIHPTKDFVSTSPVFYSLQKVTGVRYVTEQKFKEYIKIDDNYDVLIGNDVCISTGVKILGGISVGDGAIIGAGAVVTKDVPPYSIIAGVPAKVIKMRFNDDQIEFLKKFKWWDRGEVWLLKNSAHFENIEQFITHFEGEEN